MVYDEELADRIRLQFAGDASVTERRMFGGLAFLVGGHLAIAASRLGGALVRVDPAHTERLVARTKAEVAVMRGRPAPGWLRVASDDLRTSRQLTAWVERSTAYVRTLPPKKISRRR